MKLIPIIGFVIALCFAPYHLQISSDDVQANISTTQTPIKQQVLKRPTYKNQAFTLGGQTNKIKSYNLKNINSRSFKFDGNTLVNRNEEIGCLAHNIYFEAAVESTAGKLAVAHVTHNRVVSDRYPNTYCKVIKEGPVHADGFPKRDRCQFSWYCDGKHDVPFLGRNWSNIQDLASYFYMNTDDLRDITDGATHYYADYIDSPKWAYQKKKTVKIDTHIFYR